MEGAIGFARPEQTPQEKNYLWPCHPPCVCAASAQRRIRMPGGGETGDDRGGGLGTGQHCLWELYSVCWGQTECVLGHT